MVLPEQRVRIVAADPIEVGERRLLPSVLVNTLSYRGHNQGLFHAVRARPVSVVVEDAKGAKWYEIPNATANALSTMASAAAAIAAVSIAVIAVALLLKRR